MRKDIAICLYARASIVLAGALIAACAPERDFEPRVRNADADNGRLALRSHECGVCHLIPGVPGAVGRVGPTLAAYSRFPYVAGKFPNEPELLIRWIRDAPALAPQTAMPAIAVTEQEARDMAAYLYTLE